MREELAPNGTVYSAHNDGKRFGVVASKPPDSRQGRKGKVALPPSYPARRLSRKGEKRRDIQDFRPNQALQRTGHANDVAADFFAAGRTQAQLAKAVKAPLRTVQNWEQGRREPALAALNQLAKLLGTTLDELVIEPAPKKGKKK